MASGHVLKPRTKSGRGVWKAVANLDPDPVTGLRRRTTRGGFATKAEAQRALRGLLTSLEQGSYVERTDLSLGEYIDRVWFPAHCQVIKESTAENYWYVLAAHVLPDIGRVRLQNLTAPMLTAFYGRLRTGDGPTGRPQSAKSVRNLHVILNKALGDAVTWGYITRNPAAGAKAPRPGDSSSQFRTWTADQVSAFLHHVAGTDCEALFTLPATTGMRRGEVLGVRNADIDLDRGELSVVQSIVVVGGRPTVSTPKTSRSVRSVSLDPGTIAILRSHRIRTIERQLADGVTAEGDLVFTDQHGKVIKPDWMSRTFRSLAEEAGLPHIRLHDLRHTWATLALRNGTHPKIVQERLGHANISTTLNTYSHVTAGMQAQAVEDIANLILPARPR